jgi:hypothetical protein
MSSSRACQSDAVLPIGATGMARGNDGGHINWWVDLMIAIARGVYECDRDLRSNQVSWVVWMDIDIRDGSHCVCCCSTRVIESLSQMYRFNGGVCPGQAIFG